MSNISVDGTRSSTDHAGVPAKDTAVFSCNSGGAAEITVVVASPGDGRKVKLHRYMVSMDSVTTSGNFMSSSTTATAGTLTGQLNGAGGASFEQIGDPIAGIGTCAGGESLVVSAGGGKMNGNVTYSLVPQYEKIKDFIYNFTNISYSKWV